MPVFTTADKTQTKDATLRIDPGAPHGMCTTLKDRVNAKLLDFIQGGLR